MAASSSSSAASSSSDLDTAHREGRQQAYPDDTGIPQTEWSPRQVLTQAVDLLCAGNGTFFLSQALAAHEQLLCIQEHRVADGPEAREPRWAIETELNTRDQETDKTRLASTFRTATSVMAHPQEPQKYEALREIPLRELTNRTDASTEGLFAHEDDHRERHIVETVYYGGVSYPESCCSTATAEFTFSRDTKPPATAASRESLSLRQKAASYETGKTGTASLKTAALENTPLDACQHCSHSNPLRSGQRHEYLKAVRHHHHHHHHHHHQRAAAPPQSGAVCPSKDGIARGRRRANCVVNQPVSAVARGKGTTNAMSGAITAKENASTTASSSQVTDVVGSGSVTIGFHEVVVDSKDSVVYRVPSSFTFVEKLGSGAYGTVASFRDETRSEMVAIKKVKDAFHDLVDARRVLREIRILRQLDHPNVIRLLDLLPPDTLDFKDVYIVSELMESDLHRIIQSSQRLTASHVKHFMKQMLYGLRHIHRRGIIHRDIKPSNILVNLDCHIKICDFGLARAADICAVSATSVQPFQKKATAVAERNESLLTDYVVTRWYRPPEVLLGLNQYGTPVDVWSLGCVFGELLRREALFSGKDEADQLEKVLTYATHFDQPVVLAELPETAAGRSAREFLRKSCEDGRCARCPVEDLLPAETDPLAIDLLKQLIAFSPAQRITPEAALVHPYLASYPISDPEEATVQTSTDSGSTPKRWRKISWEFDNFVATRGGLQSRVYQEIGIFHPEILSRERLFTGRESPVPCGSQQGKVSEHCLSRATQQGMSHEPQGSQGGDAGGRQCSEEEACCTAVDGERCHKPCAVIGVSGQCSSAGSYRTSSLVSASDDASGCTSSSSSSSGSSSFACSFSGSSACSVVGSSESCSRSSAVSGLVSSASVRRSTTSSLSSQVVGEGPAFPTDWTSKNQAEYVGFVGSIDREGLCPRSETAGGQKKGNISSETLRCTSGSGVLAGYKVPPRKQMAVGPMEVYRRNDTPYPAAATGSSAGMRLSASRGRVYEMKGCAGASLPVIANSGSSAAMPSAVEWSARMQARGSHLPLQNEHCALFKEREEPVILDDDPLAAGNLSAEPPKPGETGTRRSERGISELSPSHPPPPPPPNNVWGECTTSSIARVQKTGNSTQKNNSANRLVERPRVACAEYACSTRGRRKKGRPLL